MKDNAVTPGAGDYRIEVEAGLCIMPNLSLTASWKARVVFVHPCGGISHTGAVAESLRGFDPHKEQVTRRLEPELKRFRAHLAKTGQRLEGNKPPIPPVAIEVSEEERQEQEFTSYIAGLDATYETRRNAYGEIVRVIVDLPMNFGLMPLSMLFWDWAGCKSMVETYIAEPDAEWFEWPEDEDESMDPMVRTAF